MVLIATLAPHEPSIGMRMWVFVGCRLIRPRLTKREPAPLRSSIMAADLLASIVDALPTITYLGGILQRSVRVDHDAVYIDVEPRLHATNLQKRRRRKRHQIPPFSGVRPHSRTCTTIRGLTKGPWREPPQSGHQRLREFARHVRDAVVDFERTWSRKIGMPVRVRVRTHDCYPRVKTIEADARAGEPWAVTLTRFACDRAGHTADKAVEHALIEAVFAAITVRRAKERRTRSNKRKRENRALLKACLPRQRRHGRR